jgi:hypothetical protein
MNNKRKKKKEHQQQQMLGRMWGERKPHKLLVEM